MSSLSYLPMMISKLPMVAICVAGIILSMLLWARCPRAALLTLIASAVMLAGVFMQTAITFRLIYGAASRGNSAGMMLWSVLSSVGGLFSFAGWVLLLIAVFTGRARPAKVPYAEPVQHAPRPNAPL